MFFSLVSQAARDGPGRMTNRCHPFLLRKIPFIQIRLLLKTKKTSSLWTKLFIVFWRHQSDLNRWRESFAGPCNWPLCHGAKIAFFAYLMKQLFSEESPCIIEKVYRIATNFWFFPTFPYNSPRLESVFCDLQTF